MELCDGEGRVLDSVTIETLAAIVTLKGLGSGGWSLTACKTGGRNSLGRPATQEEIDLFVKRGGSIEVLDALERVIRRGDVARRTSALLDAKAEDVVAFIHTAKSQLPEDEAKLVVAMLPTSGTVKISKLAVAKTKLTLAAAKPVSHADLALDTLAFNAGSGAVDTLRAGVPLLSLAAGPPLQGCRH